MHEYIINLHIHTKYSDGTGTHKDVVDAAFRSGIDIAIVTDHNIWVQGPEGYYNQGGKRVLLLVGEEIHDQSRQPQKNHLLVLGAHRELAQYANDPLHLIASIQEAGGISFIAHPYEAAAPIFNQDDIPWVDWEIQGYSGIEIWNAMSEFKSRLKSYIHALYYSYNPGLVANGPFPSAINKWDELLSTGKRIVAIGGTDAHAIKASLGPLRRTVFPYEFHFKTVNTHIFTPIPLEGDLDLDRSLVLDALRQGHAFIGYDLPSPTRGFRFTAHTIHGISYMGDEVSCKGGVTLQINLPQPTDCRLLQDGKVIKQIFKRKTTIYKVTQPGVYRVEAYILFKGKRRGWIFSNPIFIS
jgi:hypothetical protein